MADDVANVLHGDDKDSLKDKINPKSSITEVNGWIMEGLLLNNGKTYAVLFYNILLLCKILKNLIAFQF